MTSWSGQPDKSWPHDQRARPRAYNLKAIADYETGPGSRVSAESAREAIATARRFCRMRREPYTVDRARSGAHTGSDALTLNLRDRASGATFDLDEF
jgi:hypothetical protein